MDERLLERLRSGDQRALAKLITRIECGAPGADRILAALAPELGRARVVGVTGAPGVGKSTLTSALVRELRARGQRVGVVAVDPSSPVSGGAILGDRVRMHEHAGDRGVFIRSVSDRGHGGGLSAATAGIIDLMDAAGLDVVLVETVGAGQSDVTIAALAGCTVVVTAPGLGDDVQALKAGILEVADVLVVNKADLPGAQRARDDLRAMLRLRRSGSAAVPVLDVVASEGRGVEAIVDAVAQVHAASGPAQASASSARARAALVAAATDYARRRLRDADDTTLSSYTRAIRSGEFAVEEAARRLLRDLLDAPTPDDAAVPKRTT